MTIISTHLVFLFIRSSIFFANVVKGFNLFFQLIIFAFLFQLLTTIHVMQMPSIPKGTRDFLPEEMSKRNYIFDTIRNVFQLYGFKPIETPAMENLSTLLGKYGEEGDKLLFKILNSGNFLQDIKKDELITENSLRLSNHICEKGLRYDLTVPFARFVVMHQNEIHFPFKRYQIQPVWRADRPQKGRYREFYQCDADIIGSDSLLNEVELIQIIDEVFGRLGIRIRILVNNRKVLSGIAEIIGEPDKISDITIAIDKWDKVGNEKVNEELLTKGISMQSVNQLQPILRLKGSNHEKLNNLKIILAESYTGLKGIEELEFIFNQLRGLEMTNPIELELTLARGLNYYTGAIFEVKAIDVEMGSITGGGRYDNLTGVFGLPDVSGVGISFGADRIFDVLNQLNLYPESTTQATQVMFVHFGDKEVNFILPILHQLRKKGIRVELYPEAAKIKKQMAYANNNRIQYVVLAGENEITKGRFTLKTMQTGEQKEITLDEILTAVKSNDNH